MTEQPQVRVVASSDEVLPAENSDTRKKVRKGASIAIGACIALLLIDDQVRRFQRRKNITVAAEVADKSES